MISHVDGGENGLTEQTTLSLTETGVSWYQGYVACDRTNISNIFQQMPTKSLLEMRKDVVYLPTETRSVPGRTPFFITTSKLSLKYI